MAVYKEDNDDTPSKLGYKIFWKHDILDQKERLDTGGRLKNPELFSSFFQTLPCLLPLFISCSNG